MITTNPILLDGKNTVYGGRIIDASINIEFSAASSFSISVVSETGTYEISEASLRASGSPMVLKVGDKEFKIFPVSYTIENSEGIKTLKVEFLDSSVKYLDKKFVLLKGTHITADNINNPNVDMDWIIAVGTPYEAYSSGPTEVFRAVTTRIDGRGYEKQGYGLFSSSTSTYYSLLELLNELGKAKFGAIIEEDTKTKIKEILCLLYNKTTYSPQGIGFISGTREYDFVGTVREVLSSWGDEIGVVFYWDPADEKVRFFEPNDVVSDADIAETVESMGECSCKSSTLTRSIQSNVLNGNIVVAASDIADQPNSGGGSRGGSSPFYLLDPWEAASLYTYTSSEDQNTRVFVGAKDLANGSMASGLNNLIKAASAGEDFYLGYVLHSLASDYTAFGGMGYNRIPNEAITQIYGGGLQVVAEGVSDGGHEPFSKSDVQAIIDGIKGSDKDYFDKTDPILIFSAENLITAEADAPTDNLKKQEQESLDKLFNSTSEERVFQTMKIIAENYNRWYFSKSLITDMKFGFRTYEKTASWAFHGIEVSATPLAGLHGVRMKNRGETVDPSTATAINIPLAGEAADWKRELPPVGSVRDDSDFIAPSDGGGIIATGEDLEGDESFSLYGLEDAMNVVEFVLDGLPMENPDEDYTTEGKLKKVFGLSSFTHAAFQGSYSNLLAMREAYEIEGNKDYGVILIDAYAGTKGLASAFDLSLPSPVIKEVPRSSNAAFQRNTGWNKKKLLYCRGLYDYDAMLSGLPDFIKPAASVKEATGIYGETTSFSYTMKANAGSDSSTDENGRDFDLYAKGVFVPKDSSTTVQNNIGIQNLSFLELLSTAGTIPKDYFDLHDLRNIAANWAEKLSVNDLSAQYSQQITFVGIPESIPSIAEGLEGLSISVDENGVSTQVSVGSRKIKREIFEKRQRVINEGKYRAERSRLTLIPNGRFSTRFLAGNQL